jgi:hypothetical protein
MMLSPNSKMVETCDQTRPTAYFKDGRRG